MSPATRLVATLSLIPRAFATAASSTSPTRVAPIRLASAAPITGRGVPTVGAARRRPDLPRPGALGSPRLAPAGWRRCSPAGTTETRGAHGPARRRPRRPRTRRGLGLVSAAFARAGLQEQPDDPDTARIRRSPRRATPIEARFAGLDRPPALPVSSGVLVSLRVRCA